MFAYICIFDHISYMSVCVCMMHIMLLSLSLFSWGAGCKAQSFHKLLELTRLMYRISMNIVSSLSLLPLTLPDSILFKSHPDVVFH